MTDSIIQHPLFSPPLHLDREVERWSKTKHYHTCNVMSYHILAYRTQPFPALQPRNETCNMLHLEQPYTTGLGTSVLADVQLELAPSGSSGNQHRERVFVGSLGLRRNPPDPLCWVTCGVGLEMRGFSES